MPVLGRRTRVHLHRPRALRLGVVASKTAPKSAARMVKRHRHTSKLVLARTRNKKRNVWKFPQEAGKSASTSAKGDITRTARDRASASTSAKGANARTARDQVSASTSAKGANARTARDRASASTSASGAGARTVIRAYEWTVGCRLKRLCL